MRRLILTPWHQADPRPLLAGCKAIVPNKRAARFLGVPFESLETLARRRLRAQPLGVAKPLQTHAIMLEAAGCLSVTDPGGAARSVAPVVRTLLRAGADLERLAAEGQPRVQRLARCAIGYRDALRVQGLLDPAEALGTACEASAEREPILVYGYPRLGLDERALIESVAADGSMVILPCEDHAQYRENEEAAAYFADHGWVVERLEATSAKTPLEGLVPSAVTVSAHVYGHLEDEARGVLAQAKALLTDGISPDEIAIVARNDAFYGPTLLTVAHEFQLPLRALYAVPLTSTRFGSWLQHLLEAVRQGLPFEPTLRFLEHPLSPDFPAETRSAALRHHPSGAAAWRALDVELGLLSWPASDTRAQWGQALRRLIQALGLRKKAARWPQELLAIRALTESLPLLLDPPEAPMTQAAFAETLLEALHLITVPAQPGRGGIELHTPLSLYGARYQHVFVIGMAENVLPAPVSNSPVLDFHDRKQLQPLGVTLEDAAGAARREFLSFASLMQVATERLTLSYPRLLGNREALPSGYFAQMKITPIPMTDRPAASLAEVRRHWVALGLARDEDPMLPRTRAALGVERSREAYGAPDDYDGAVGEPFELEGHVFSASQLTMIGQCPFKWFLSYALGIAEVEELEEDLTPATRGSVYHDALDLAAKAAASAPDLRAGMLAHLETAFAEAEAKAQLQQLPAWQARREEHLRTLRAAIESEQFLDPGASLAGTEQKFKGTWRGLKVVGFVDRIDHTPDGLVLIDYKTSSQPPAGAQDADRKASLDIQLPLYVETAAPALFPDEPVRGARYYSLTRAKTLKEAEVDDAALEAFATEVKRRLAEGDYPVRPDAAQKACQYCDFQLVCRKGPRLARKEITP